MKIQNVIIWSVAIVLLAAGASAAVLTRSQWYPRLFPNQQQDQKQDAVHAHPGALKRIELSKQARLNIGLNLKELQPRPYEKKLRLPGVIVPRPGKTTVKISMPITSVVKAIHAFPGQTVKPGDKLFTLDLHYHEVHKTQAELYKTVQEMKINEAEQKRIEKPVSAGAIAKTKMLELQYQRKRLEVAVHALELNLKLHRFTVMEIEHIRQGKFTDERTIAVPSDATAQYELGHLHVKVGDQVEAGKTLCELDNHKLLYVEASAFPQDIAIVQEAIMNSKKINAGIVNLSGKKLKKVEPLRILFMDQHISKTSQTVSVYLQLENKSIHTYEREGRTFLLWAYRPGQRVYVTIPVEKFENGFVLPVAAVIRDGPESYVYRENGKVLEQQPVVVMYRDQSNVVIKNNGDILKGQNIVHHGAAQIFRAIKMQSGGGGGHQHHHH